MPARKKPYHHGNLERVLIDGALAAIAEQGPEGFTLRDVARRAGVSPAAPYRHFADKDALLAAVAGECAQRLGEVMTAAVARAGDDPVERFRATGIAYVRFAVEHPAHFRVMNLPGLAAAVPRQLQADTEAWKAREHAGLAAAQRTGAISDEARLDEILLAASCVMHGLAHMIVDGHQGFVGITPDQAEKLAFAVSGAFGVGLLPRAVPVAADPSCAPVRPRRTRQRKR